MQPVAHDDVHQAHRERNIGTGINGNMPVGNLRRSRPVGIDHHQLAAIAPRLLDERPEVDVVAVNVGCPGNDVFRVAELLGLGTDLPPVNGNHGFAARGGANGAQQLRCTQAMEKPHIHGAAVQYTQVAAIGIGQYRFRAERSADPLQAGDDFIQGLLPADAPKCRCPARAFRSHPPHGIEHPVGRVNTVKIFRNFRAQKSLGDGVIGIPLNACCPPILHRDQRSAGVGTIVRAGGMNHSFHRSATLRHYPTRPVSRESHLKYQHVAGPL